MRQRERTESEHITMQDVAELAGVSIATVSNVLNSTKPVSDRLRKLVFSAVEELRYTPNYWAQSIRKQSGNLLGIIIPEIRNTFFADIIRGVEDAAYRSGYSLMICNTDNDPGKWNNYVSMLYAKRVNGLIITGAWLQAKRERDYLIEKGLPVTMVNFEHESDRIDIVGVSRRTGGRKAAEYFLTLGHPRIALIEGRKLYVSPPEFDVVSGYIEALESGGRSLSHHVVSGSYTLEGGHLAMQQILSEREIPTAVFCENDLIALGAVRAVFDAGLKVPEDVSVIGFDDIAYAKYAVPELTTIAVNRYRLGELAVRMVFDRIADPQLPKQRMVLTPEIIVRGSTRIFGGASAAAGIHSA